MLRSKPNVDTFEQIHQTLTTLLLNEGDLAEMVKVMAEAAGQTVVVVNMAGVIVAGQRNPQFEGRFDKFMRFWGSRPDPLSRKFQQQAAQFELLLVPLIIQQEMIGILATEATSLGAIETLLTHNSNIITLALLKFQAMQTLVTQQQREVLENLLTPDKRPKRHLIEQARTLGWEFEAKSVVILLQIWQPPHQSANRAADQAHSRRFAEQLQPIINQVFSEHSPDSIVVLGGSGFIILPHLPGPEAESQTQARALIKLLMKRIELTKIKLGYAIACGGFHANIEGTASLEGLQRSYQEAQQALDIGTRLEMHRPIWFEDIYLYLLLERSGRDDEVRDWVQRTLGPLVEYDRRNKTEMLQTLESYFGSNQTLQEAARILHIHANTLKYRLGRIEQILGQDPFKGENQLRFYLATKMARLLK